MEKKEMSPPVTEAIKAKAEVYYGDEACRHKFTLLLAEMGLPDTLLTVPDIEECGYVKETGFVWLRRRHKKKEKAASAYYRNEDAVVSFDVVITAYFQPKKIKNLTGVKAREFLIWFNLTEICVEEEEETILEKNVTFKSLFGLSRSFPMSWFLQDEVQDA